MRRVDAKLAVSKKQHMVWEEVKDRVTAEDTVISHTVYKFLDEIRNITMGRKGLC